MNPWDNLMQSLNDRVLSEFGQQVTYTPGAGSPFTVTGVLETGVGEEDNMPGTYAVLFVKTDSFEQPPARGDEVAVGDVTYKVVDLDVDPVGGIRLTLHRHGAAL
jgi:hypothetical protein